tara:strand:+ start:4916 stop:5995 length:1080 start_codon:yes stop_codon:yes gene_type:complete
MNHQKAEEILSKIEAPYTKTDLISANLIKGISVDNNQVSIQIEFGYPIEGIKQELSEKIKIEFSKLDAIKCNIEISSKILSHASQKGTQVLPNVKNTIAVASGKGGVGKSTTSVNLALALQVEGANVGILDADIYGPSQPRMLGLKGKPDSLDGKTVEPKEGHHIQSMSIGYLIDEETPMIWRGPMVTGALEQLLNETNWKDLDYLVIDLPPGTGDIQLTLCQKIPVSGAVIVTTPQDIALLDAKKALKMFEKVQVPVLGVVENMSTHICSKCGNEEHIFGHGGGESMSHQYGIDLLGSLPLDMQIREGVDNGNPSVALEPNSKVSETYRNIARNIAAKISLQARDYTSKFPKIVVENN